MQKQTYLAFLDNSSRKNFWRRSSSVTSETILTADEHKFGSPVLASTLAEFCYRNIAITMIFLRINLSNFVQFKRY